MTKPERLRKGDKVAIVSLSSGRLGDERFIHKYELGKKRLEEKFGLEVVAMPNALKGEQYLYEHPEKRLELLLPSPMQWIPGSHRGEHRTSQHHIPVMNSKARQL